MSELKYDNQVELLKGQIEAIDFFLNEIEHGNTQKFDFSNIPFVEVSKEHFDMLKNFWENCGVIEISYGCSKQTRQTITGMLIMYFIKMPDGKFYVNCDNISKYLLAYFNELLRNDLVLSCKITMATR